MSANTLVDRTVLVLCGLAVVASVAWVADHGAIFGIAEIAAVAGAFFARMHAHRTPL